MHIPCYRSDNVYQMNQVTVQNTNIIYYCNLKKNPIRLCVFNGFTGFDLFESEHESFVNLALTCTRCWDQ